VVHDLGDPAVLAGVERRARFRQHRIGTADELDVFRRRLGRRQGVEVGRVAVEPAEVFDVGRFEVVVEGAVVAAQPQCRFSSSGSSTISAISLGV
jgi:hypothetical protein